MTLLDSLHLNEHAIELVGKGSTGAAVITNGGFAIAGLTVDEWTIAAAIFGMVLGAATFGFNIWFKMKYQRGNKED